MPKVLILCCSAYGHIEHVAEAVVEGMREAGAEAVTKRVPELAPEEIARRPATSWTRRRRSLR